MSAITTRPRAKAAAKPTSEAAPVDTPATVMVRVQSFLESAKALIESAINAAGDGGDPGCRLLWMAQSHGFPKVLAALRPKQWSEASIDATLDPLFDLQALFDGVYAMHANDGRGLLAKEARSLLEAVSLELDRPAFWEDQSAPPKKVPPLVTVSGRMSFLTTTTTKRGRWVSSSDFDVPDEEYGPGWHTGMAAAAELMRYLEANPQADCLHILKAAVDTISGPMVNGPSKRGAGAGFMRMLEDMLRFAAARCDHQRHINARISRQAQIDAELDGRTPRRLLAPLEVKE